MEYMWLQVWYRCGGIGSGVIGYAHIILSATRLNSFYYILRHSYLPDKQTYDCVVFSINQELVMVRPCMRGVQAEKISLPALSH